MSPDAPDSGASSSSPESSHAGQRSGTVSRIGHPRDWQWRQRLRTDPKTKGPYRVVIAFLGALFIVLAALTGWLPGPGGIPLALVGLAILASEFHWASRILDRCSAAYHRFADWVGGLPMIWRIMGAVATAAGVVLVIWAFLALTSVPSFVPGPAATFLDNLPGIH